MSLPKITKPLMESTSVSMAEDPIKYLIAGMDELHDENNELGEFLYRCSIHPSMSQLEQEAFLRGAISVYILLRNQAQADELDKQWGEG